MPKLVRIKPYDPRRGQVLRRYTLSRFNGIRLEEGRGWYQVDDDVAAYLATIRNVDGDELSPLAFEVCTPEEAEAIAERETHRKLNEDRAAPSAPIIPGVRDATMAAAMASKLPDPDEPRKAQARVGQRPQKAAPGT
jgi:hypothetical protein